MPKTRRTYKKKQNKRKSRKVKGGDCGCGDASKFKIFSGGYGPASYQGGVDKHMIPFGADLSKDPASNALMTSERFSGGKRKKSTKKQKGGAYVPVDPLLGGKGYDNPVLGGITSAGAFHSANAVTGGFPYSAYSNVVQL
jgi:hypothetical protein